MTTTTNFFPPRLSTKSRSCFPVAKNCCHGYPLQGPVTRARDFDHFKKFARKGKFFEMLSWGGLGGRSPPQESPLPVPCPPGGVWGASPPRNLRYPCLASAAAVPCPRALPPIFFVRKFFRPKNFSAEKNFDRKFFRPKIFSDEKFLDEKIFGRKVFRPNFFRPPLGLTTPLQGTEYGNI